MSHPTLWFNKLDHTSLKVLVNKLNDTCRNSLEAAAGMCLSRTNYNVEIEHWLIKLLRSRSDGDLAAIFRRFEYPTPFAGRLAT